MRPPYDHECCYGGSQCQMPISALRAEQSSTSSTLTDPKLCQLCKIFSVQLTHMMDRWLSLDENRRASISTFNRYPAQEIEQACSEARSIIEALADTWSHHLVFTHQGERIDGINIGMRTSHFQWLLKLYETSYFEPWPNQSPRLKLSNSRHQQTQDWYQWEQPQNSLSSEKTSQRR